MNNFALLHIELEREREFRFILKPLTTFCRYSVEHGPRCRYALVINVRRLVCECVHASTLKREDRITASSPVKRQKL